MPQPNKAKESRYFDVIAERETLYDSATGKFVRTRTFANGIERIDGPRFTGHIRNVEIVETREFPHGQQTIRGRFLGTVSFEGVEAEFASNVQVTTASPLTRGRPVEHRRNIALALCKECLWRFKRYRGEAMTEALIRTENWPDVNEDAMRKALKFGSRILKGETFLFHRCFWEIEPHESTSGEQEHFALVAERQLPLAPRGETVPHVLPIILWYWRTGLREVQPLPEQILSAYIELQSDRVICLGNKDRFESFVKGNKE